MPYRRSFKKVKMKKKVHATFNFLPTLNILTFVEVYAVVFRSLQVEISAAMVEMILVHLNEKNFFIRFTDLCLSKPLDTNPKPFKGGMCARDISADSLREVKLPESKIRLRYLAIISLQIFSKSLKFRPSKCCDRLENVFLIKKL
ncbi:hypothetical protein Glove_110g134 [Diversispora epigaea]|uniref:Uncharacterized protein n=1 Tax=Diversispora epigaea TaxID=1348612 RepID=A0A397J4E4_9GLOM|nr:hypothetical protein Glove_110g134 [Diversispora epigaea]